MRRGKVHGIAVYAGGWLAPYIGEVVVVEHIVAPFLVVEDEFLGVDAMIPSSVIALVYGRWDTS